MPNRSQRRQMMRQQIEKSKALVKSYSRQKRIEGLIQNGITVQDLNTEFERGREYGFKEATLRIIKCSYAGIILALQESFGFDENQCFRAVQAVDNKTIWALNYAELADEVLEKTGIELNLDEPFNRILQREKDGDQR